MVCQVITSGGKRGRWNIWCHPYLQSLISLGCRRLCLILLDTYLPPTHTQLFLVLRLKLEVDPCLFWNTHTPRFSLYHSSANLQIVPGLPWVHFFTPVWFGLLTNLEIHINKNSNATLIVLNFIIVNICIWGFFIVMHICATHEYLLFLEGRKRCCNL